MNLTEVKATQDIARYIGESVSWKKAWLVTYHRWRLIIKNEYSGHKTDKDGFCLVVENILEHKLVSTVERCGNCPVSEVCLTKGGKPRDNPSVKKMLQYLENNKERIFNL